MSSQSRSTAPGGLRRTAAVGLGALLLALAGCSTPAQTPGEHRGGEANLQLPDLGLVNFGGISGRTLLAVGLVICLGGLIFGLVSFLRLRDLPVHESMREVSELIYETCKAYLVQQGKFLLMLWLFIGAVIFIYFQSTSLKCCEERGG